MEANVKLVEYHNEHWYKIELKKEVDGIEVPYFEYWPSYTTKLGIVDKPFLARWRGDIGNREADIRMRESQEKGSNIHNAWFVMSQGGAVIYQPKKRPQFSQEEFDEIYNEHVGNVAVVTEQDEQIDVWKLQQWDEILQPEYLEHERIVYSKTHKEAGTCDKVIRVLKDGNYMINGAKPLFLKAGLYVVDLKTGNMVSDESYMQISGYKEAFIEMELYKREDFAGGLIVHTGAKTKKGIEGLATLLRTNEELDQDYIDYRNASNLWLRKHKDDTPTVFEFPALIKLKQRSEHVINI